jgi:radical SAM superfamily enzyme YgiQ (UPF0313 family)
MSQEVKSFDNEVRFPTLEKAVNDVDALCISSTSSDWYVARRMVERVKELIPNIPVIVGGVHATFLDEHVLKNSKVDYVVRGEGEKTLPELLEAIENGKGIHNVLGTSYKEDGEFFRNGDRLPLTTAEIEETPLPAFDLMPFGLYEDISVESSRGCQFSCSFCSIMHRHLWRGISAEALQKRIEHALCYTDKLIGNKSVFLVDDSFTADRGRAEEILRNLSETDFRGASLSFVARADDLLKFNIIEYCTKIPLKAIGMGVESGRDEVLKDVHKGITTRDIEKCASLFSTYGISKYAIYSFIIGFPWESKKDCLGTIDFAHKIVSEYGGAALINWLRFFPGSSLWNSRGLYGIEEGPEIYDDAYYKCNEFRVKSSQLEEDDIIDIEKHCNRLNFFIRL